MPKNVSKACPNQCSNQCIKTNRQEGPVLSTRLSLRWELSKYEYVIIQRVVLSINRPDN